MQKIPPIVKLYVASLICAQKIELHGPNQYRTHTDIGEPL